MDFGIAGLGLGRGVGERVNPIPEGVIGLKEDDLPYMTNVLNMCRIVRNGQISLCFHGWVSQCFAIFLRFCCMNVAIDSERGARLASLTSVVGSFTFASKS